MSNLAPVQPQFDDDDTQQDVLIQFEDNTFDPVTPYQEDFTDQVREAQTQLLQLRQQEEQLERQKKELEELQCRKEDFIQGRARIAEQLSRAVNALEREAADSQRRSDQCADSRELLEHHLRTVQSLRPELWSRPELRDELNSALTHIEDAEEDLTKTSPLLETIKGGRRLAATGAPSGSAIGGIGAQAFLHWFKSGLAFTLPIMIFGLVVILLTILLGGA